MKNNNYPFRPRGIAKWGAFAAVIDGDEQKRQVIKKRKLTNNLVEERLLELDQNAQYAKDNNIQVSLVYIEEDQLLTIIGHINDIDLISKSISINEKIIPNDKVVDIQLEKIIFDDMEDGFCE